MTELPGGMIGGMSYSRETCWQIWNDETGERYEVSEDRDGLGLTEIRSVTNDGKIGERITIPNEALEYVIEALKERLGELSGIRFPKG